MPRKNIVPVHHLSYQSKCAMNTSTIFRLISRDYIGVQMIGYRGQGYLYKHANSVREMKIILLMCNGCLVKLSTIRCCGWLNHLSSYYNMHIPPGETPIDSATITNSCYYCKMTFFHRLSPMSCMTLKYTTNRN